MNEGVKPKRFTRSERELFKETSSLGNGKWGIRDDAKSRLRSSNIAPLSTL